MSDLKKFTSMIIKFRDERDWKQFHHPKDVAISLLLEAAEVAEHFQWRGDIELQEYIKSHKEEIGDELADVLYWVLLMSHDMKIDLPQALEAKLKKNTKKYPVEKAKGRATKYTKL